MTYSDGDLTHFGVKGMKWGVRNEDKRPSSRRIKLEARNINKGLSAEEAARKADRRLKVEKALAISGGVAASAVAAYVLHREIGKRYSSVLIKAGDTVTNINALGDKQDYDRRLYTTFNKQDTKKYKGLLAKTLQGNAPNTTIFQTTLKATEDIKAPSHKQAEKIYKELQGKLSKDRYHNLSLDYKQFNRLLVDDTYTNPEGKYFYQELKKRGFNSVLDANDQFISGYNTKKPLILFNAASSTVVKGREVVQNSEIDKLYKRQLLGIASKKVGVPVVTVGAAFLAPRLAANAVKTSRHRKQAEAYLKAHPNSKFTVQQLYTLAEKGEL